MFGDRVTHQSAAERVAPVGIIGGAVRVPKSRTGGNPGTLGEPPEAAATTGKWRSRRPQGHGLMGYESLAGLSQAPRVRTREDMAPNRNRGGDGTGLGIL